MLGRPLATSVTALLAEVDDSALTRSFLFALVLVAPYGLWQWSRVRARRREQTGQQHTAAPPNAPAGVDDPGPPALEEVIEQIAVTGRELPADRTTTVDVPAEVTIGGSAAEDRLVDALVGDALARSGLEPVSESPGADARVRRVIKCRRR